VRDLSFTAAFAAQQARIGRLTRERDALLQALKEIAAMEGLCFAECTDAERLIATARAAIALTEAK
jgi:hypothetical protein